ncbi:MAG: type II secretion system protein GspN [Deltaproteobacteria bacterium]|nr:type II secretion system protein GspN [Deltaproteobacteria bacterium]
MTSNWHKLPIALALAVYIAAVALISAFYEFPFDDITELIKNHIEVSTPLRLEFNAPKPETPFSLSINKLNISMAETAEPLRLFKSTKVRIKLKPTRLLRGRVTAHLEAAAWEGEVKGRLDYKIFGSKKFCLTLTKINFPGFSLTGGNGTVSLSGTLQGQSSVCGEGDIFPQSGSGKIRIKKGRFVGRPITNLPKVEIDFNLLEVNFNIDGDKLIVDSLDLNSQDMNMRLKGQIRNFKNPFLNLSGTVNLGPANKPKTRINFYLTGPAAKPQLKFSPAGITSSRK